jgi:hypothetical protein
VKEHYASDGFLKRLFTVCAPHGIKAPHEKMVHTVCIRLTINLDPDVYSYTSAYAGAKGITLSAALGELVRRAEQTPQPGSDSPKLKMNEHGYLEIAETSDPITPQMVKEAAEDELV